MGLIDSGGLKRAFMVYLFFYICIMYGRVFLNISLVLGR